MLAAILLAELTLFVGLTQTGSGDSTRVVGRVTCHAHSQPVPHAMVIASSDSELAETQADGRGRYAFLTLLPGVYSLTACADSTGCGDVYGVTTVFAHQDQLLRKRKQPAATSSSPPASNTWPISRSLTPAVRALARAWTLPGNRFAPRTCSAAGFRPVPLPFRPNARSRSRMRPTFGVRSLGSPRSGSVRRRAGPGFCEHQSRGGVFRGDRRRRAGTTSSGSLLRQVERGALRLSAPVRRLPECAGGELPVADQAVASVVAA